MKMICLYYIKMIMYYDLQLQNSKHHKPVVLNECPLLVGCPKAELGVEDGAAEEAVQI